MPIFDLAEPKSMLLKRALLLGIVLGSFGCQKNEQVVNQIAENNSYLRKKFGGRYELVSSLSSKSVDLNSDGISSVDLLSEVTEIKQSFVEIKFLDLEPGDVLFNVFWPEQYISADGETQPVGVVSGVVSTIHYPLQPIMTYAIIEEKEGTINLSNPDTESSPEKWTLPESVNILQDGEIEVVTTKNLYTSSGWETTTISSVYRKTHSF
jgi:hypothetical protein